jgi:hypothetical protein
MRAYFSSNSIIHALSSISKKSAIAKIAPATAHTLSQVLFIPLYFLRNSFY